MRCLLISSVFLPDNAPESRRIDALASALASRGHDVTILAARPHYPSGIVPKEWHRIVWRDETLPYGSVRRCWIYGGSRGGSAGKALNWASFLPSGALALANLGRSFDLVWAVWPPFSGHGLGWLAARASRAALVLEVQDVYPDTAIQLGAVQAGPIARILTRFNVRLHSSASATVVISPGFKANLASKGVPPDSIHLIRNWVSISSEVPRPDAIPRDSSPMTVLYAGNIGPAQGLQVVLEAARLLRSEPGVQFQLMGQGTERRNLARQIEDDHLDNVRLLPAIPYDRVGESLAAADALLVHLAPTEVNRTTIPSKLGDFIAAGRPVIAGLEGDAAALVASAGCGIVIPPGNPAALADAALKLRGSAELRHALGLKGAAYAREHLAVEVLAPAYVELLESVIQDARRTSQTAPRGRAGCNNVAPAGRAEERPEAGE